jgi:outer membrane protein assembly factor BamB
MNFLLVPMPHTLLAAVVLAAAAAGAPAAQSTLPSAPLAMRAFTLQFDPAGTFALAGPGWPPMSGTWTTSGASVTLQLQSGPEKCTEPGRYTFAVEGARVTFEAMADLCQPRRMILDRSQWMPPGAAPAPPSRTIRHTAGPADAALPRAAGPSGSWPSFRGPEASGSAEGQRLPDRWSPTSGENILWRTPIPGLAHSSPIVWGDLVFLTTAISGRGDATFKPGLYGDGDASEDRSSHRWALYALDKRTGQIRWTRTATEGAPRNKRHIKSTYASASPATDGRIVVAWFGSEGLFAYDVDGGLRWSVDLGRVDMGAYDIPAYEWGPASSPIIWNNLVIVQCDTQADSFLLALDAATGKIVWKTPREELPSWGTPTVVDTPAGPELVTNASNFVRGYDPRSGRELWKLGGSSKITAPTPIYGEGLHIVASGRGPERPIFAVRPGAQGDLTLTEGESGSAQVAWSKTGRGSYMPTPLAYRGLLYVLANNGVFDAYEIGTGKEIYRQRLPLVGSGFSASPVAADGKIYLSNEDGDMLVITAGPTFGHVATNSMNETLMATPALSEGVMYVRGASTVFAIGAR